MFALRVTPRYGREQHVNPFFTSWEVKNFYSRGLLWRSPATVLRVWRPRTYKSYFVLSVSKTCSYLRVSWVTYLEDNCSDIWIFSPLLGRNGLLSRRVLQCSLLFPVNRFSTFTGKSFTWGSYSLHRLGWTRKGSVLLHDSRAPQWTIGLCHEWDLCLSEGKNNCKLLVVTETQSVTGESEKNYF